MSDARLQRDGWPAWATWDFRVLEPADGRVLAIVVLAGVAFDAGVRSGVVSIGGALTIAIGGVLLLVSGRVRTASSRTCIAGAALLGSFLAIRTSPWLVALDVLGAATLLVLAGVLARDDRRFDVSARLLLSRAITAVGHGIGAVAGLGAPVTRRLRRRGPSAPPPAILRGALLAAPIVVLLAVLLASADAVFASALRVRVDVPDDLLAHVVLIVLGALGIGGVLRTASSTSGGELPAVERRLGTTEWTIVLGSVVALFAAFAVAQVVTLAGGADHVLETEGLTYAEYARTGYAQLLAAVVLTGLVIAALSTVASMPTSSARRRFVALSEATVVLTAVILVVALRRLGLYEDAYGWTMLRLVARTGGLWFGIVLALAAVRLAGVARTRDWFVPAALVAGVAVAITLNATDPEAVVARHNLHLAREVDAAYLTAGLSDDAVPTIVAALPSLPADVRSSLRASLCARPTSDREGPLAWNRAATAAADARRELCKATY